MKYEDTKSFLEAIQNKSFHGRIVIYDDYVFAYDNKKEGELVFNFHSEHPYGVLYTVLEALGADVHNA